MLENCTLLMRMKNDATIVENSLVVPQKVKKQNYHMDPAIPLLDVCSKELKTWTQITT